MNSHRKIYSTYEYSLCLIFSKIIYFRVSYNSNLKLVLMATAEPDSTMSSQVVTPVDVPGLEAKIIKQVEFYFGDKNLPRDKFLLRILHEEGKLL